jgi:acyl-CoA thioester hydrolase
MAKDDSVPTFRFSHPIEVRYADLDPQRHVNNAAIFVYFEQARVKYLEHLGLWGGGDFDDLGIIVAEAGASYKAPIAYTDRVFVEAGVTRLGTKSLDLEYRLRTDDGRLLATGRTVLVAYDYHRARSIPIPDEWRRVITAFEDKLPGRLELPGS